MLLKKLKLIFPFIFLFFLFALLYKELVYANKDELPSVLIGQDIPKFQLHDLLTHRFFTQNDLQGHAVLLNVWATWCYACSIEHPILLKIKNDYHVPIYSILYKDSQQDAKDWLANYGNPYIMIGDDHTGDVAIDFGVYGTPETFIIAPTGKIIYRHIGIINEDIWQHQLYPLIKKYIR